MHTEFTEMIDRTFAGSSSPKDDQALGAHLTGCETCRQYQEASRHAITALHGFSFKIEPALSGRTMAALEARAQQLEWQRSHRLNVFAGCLFAFVLTIAGSLAASKISSLISAVFPIQASQVHFGVVTFWIVPSVCICLLFLLLLLTTAERADKKGLSL